MSGRRERQESGGFAARLREVIDAYGSASQLAKAIERSEGAVRKWLRGESEPNVTDLRTLCEKTGTRIDWVVTGRGQRLAQNDAVRDIEAPAYAAPLPEPVNIPLLEAILVAVREELQGSGTVLPAPKESMLVATLYELCQARREVDREAVARLVRLAG